MDHLFTDFEPELIAAIEQYGEVKQVPAGTVLMRQGQYIRSSVLILSGLLKVYREDEEGNEIFMYHLHPGEACAISLTCIVAKEQSAIGAKSVSDSEIVLIPLDKMESWMNTYKTWYHFVVKNYRMRFNDLLDTIDGIAFKNLDERLTFYLKRQVKDLNTNRLNITHQQIAQDLNSSREVVSRLLKKMAELGKVVINRQELVIVDLDY